MEGVRPAGTDDLPRLTALAREVIAAGEVNVDGQVETRRGAQVRSGSIVELAGQQIEVVTGEAEIDVPW